MMNKTAVTTKVEETSSWTYNIACRFLQKSKQAFMETFSWGRRFKSGAYAAETVGIASDVIEAKPLGRAASYVVDKAASAGTLVGLLSEDKAKLLVTNVEKLVTDKIAISNRDVRCFAVDFAANFAFAMLVPDKAAQWWNNKRDELSSLLAESLVSSGVALIKAKEKVTSFIGSYLPNYLKSSKLSTCTNWLYNSFRDLTGAISTNVAGQYVAKGTNVLLGTVSSNIVLSYLVNFSAAITPQYVLTVMLAVKLASLVFEVVKKSAKKFEVLQIQEYLDNLIRLDPKSRSELKTTFEDPEKLRRFIAEHLSAEIKRLGGERMLDQKEQKELIAKLIESGFMVQDRPEVKELGKKNEEEILTAPISKFV